MRILIVSHGIPSKVDPQWGCFELDQARALVSLGHSVSIAAVDGRFRGFRFRRGIVYSEFGRIHAYLYYLIPYKLLIRGVLKLKMRSWMTKRLFRTIVKREGIPDIIYAHYLFNIGALDLVHKDCPNIPIVGMEHWSHLSRESLTVVDKKRGEYGYNMVDRLLAVSPSLQEQIKTHLNKQSEVVYDMVDDVFFQKPLDYSKPSKPFRFVSVGSLNETKGFDVLIKAFAHLSHRESELVVIGEGPVKNTLVDLCKQLGVDNRVVFKGRLSREDIAQILSQANAYVLASKSETFGVSYIEAMATGLPAIATRCGGPESFMNDSCGQLVDVDDIDGLKAAMDRMIEHLGDYDPRTIREYVRSRFSGEEIAKQLESIFLEEIKKKQQ